MTYVRAWARSTRAIASRPGLGFAFPAVVFVVGHLMIWGVAALTILTAGSGFPPYGDSPEAHQWGPLVDLWARKDGTWFLRIAEHGYGTDPQRAPAFYPLFPWLVGLLGRLLGGNYILAGLLISWACGLGAFLLLHRLTAERLGVGTARRTVLYLALFPMALFLQAVYSESLFLLLAIATFALAERGRFAVAAVTAGLAALTRAYGIALLPPLVMFAWRSPARRRSLASLTIVPLLSALYPLFLWLDIGKPMEFLHAQAYWSRHLSGAGPLGEILRGAHAALTAVEQVLAGTAGHRAFVEIDSFALMLVFLVLTIVVWKILGPLYGLFTATSLAIPLSFPSGNLPLLSLPRFGLTIFPLFIALAVLGRRPTANRTIIAVSSILLVVATVQWTLWEQHVG